jgi:septal ring factor EnvC (AmiA/AmiB activator)
LLPIFGRLEAENPRVMAIATRVDQVVSAPVSGRVVFAQPFRGLGSLLIIDRGGGYHAVMAGMTRLDVQRGASLVAGQAVGVVVAGEDEPARLRFELRYRGLPIDPAPWLAAFQDKVRS